LPDGAALFGGVVAEDPSAPPSGREEGGEEEHCGCLTGPIGPQQSDQSTRGYFEIEGVERSRLTVVAPQALGFDGRR
jgi:hypothetical protein